MSKAPTMLPDFIVQEFNDGAGGGTLGTLTGIAPDGTLDDVEVGSPYYNGRVWKYKECMDGGRIVSPESAMLVRSISFAATGTTALSVYMEDPNAPAGQLVPKVMNSADLDYTSGAIDPSTGLYWAPPGGLLVPPGWFFYVKTTGNMSKPGALVVRIDGGWGVHIGQLYQ